MTSHVWQNMDRKLLSAICHFDMKVISRKKIHRKREPILCQGYKMMVLFFYFLFSLNKIVIQQQINKSDASVYWHSQVSDNWCIHACDRQVIGTSCLYLDVFFWNWVSFNLTQNVIETRCSMFQDYGHQNRTTTVWF